MHCDLNEPKTGQALIFAAKNIFLMRQGYLRCFCKTCKCLGSLIEVFLRQLIEVSTPKPGHGIPTIGLDIFVF